MFMAEKIVKQHIPVETAKKTHSVLYVITIILAFIILTAANGVLPLIGTYIPVSFIIYIGTAVISLVVGFITAIIMDKETESDKLFLLGGSIVSFLSAIMISIPLLVMNQLAKQLAALSQPIGSNVTIGIIELVGIIPNPIITMILMILFFNLTFLIVFFKQEERSMKDLLVYLYSIITFLILYFLLSFFVISQFMGTIA